MPHHGTSIARTITDPKRDSACSSAAARLSIAAAPAYQAMLIALVNVNLALKNPEWKRARRPLLWIAGLPLLGLASFLVHPRPR